MSTASTESRVLVDSEVEPVGTLGTTGRDGR
jgi:hypothetical protein